ncbi:MAG: PfkB family carbohydrate kinase [Promethearchaeota archaeon]
MKHFNDIVIFGHMAIDTVIHENNGERKVHKVSVGGAVTFAALAAKSIEPHANVAIGSKIGPDLPSKLLKPFMKRKINLEGLIVDEKSSTTRFKLIYNNDKRTLICPSCCSDLTFDDYNKKIFDSRLFHLGPLCGEIKEDFLSNLAEVMPDDAKVGIDMQGFIREIRKDGSVGYVDGKKGMKTMELLHELFKDKLIMKGDDNESRSISKMPDPLMNVDFFLDKFPKAIVLITSGRHGSLLGMNEEKKIVEKIPAFQPAMNVDETGAGDTFLTSFLLSLDAKNRKFSGVKEAALFASASASFLVEKEGYHGTKSRKEIISRIKKARYYGK